jgi:hypothetical protein
VVGGILPGILVGFFYVVAVILQPPIRNYVVAVLGLAGASFGLWRSYHKEIKAAWSRWSMNRQLAARERLRQQQHQERLVKGNLKTMSARQTISLSKNSRISPLLHTLGLSGTVLDVNGVLENDPEAGLVTDGGKSEDLTIARGVSKMVRRATLDSLNSRKTEVHQDGVSLLPTEEITARLYYDSDDSSLTDSDDTGAYSDGSSGSSTNSSDREQRIAATTLASQAASVAAEAAEVAMEVRFFLTTFNFHITCLPAFLRVSVFLFLPAVFELITLTLLCFYHLSSPLGSPAPPQSAFRLLGKRMRWKSVKEFPVCRNKGSG